MWEYYYPDQLDYSDELYHHGTKGMKWGVRRYQNKDGSLTAAGKKRRTLGEAIHDHKVNKQRKANLEKARAAKATKKAEEEKAKKAAEKRQKAFEKGRIPARKMTNEELQASVNRLEAEKRYKEAVMATRPMKRLMSKMWSDAIVPGLTEGGKELVKGTLKKYGSDLLGIDEKDVKKAKTALEVAKEQADIAKYKKQAFEAERDLAEGKKNYDAFLADDKAQSDARQKYVDNMAGKNNQGNKKNKNQQQPNDSETDKRENNNSSNNSGAHGVRGEEWVKTSSASAASVKVADSSPNVKQAEAWFENPNTGEILRKTMVSIKED